MKKNNFVQTLVVVAVGLGLTGVAFAEGERAKMKIELPGDLSLVTDGDKEGSDGSTSGEMNHYIEVEVYDQPAE